MSFRLKIVLGIIVIQTLLLVILISISLNFLRLSNEIELSKRATSIATLFSVTIRDAVIHHDIEAIQSATNVIIGQPGIIYARVRDEEQVLAASGDPVALARPFVEDFIIEDVTDKVFDVYSEVSEKGETYAVVEVGVSIAELANVMYAARRQISTIAIIGMIFSILLAILLGNYFTRQLKNLRDASRSIAAGNIGYQLYLKGDDELAQTANAFNTMSRKLALMYSEKQDALNNSEQRAADLREKERRINAILDNAVDGIITIDETGEIETFNPAAAAMFGYSLADLMGGSLVSLMAEPYASQYAQWLKDYDAGGETGLIGTGKDAIGLRRDSSTFPMELDISEVLIEGRNLLIVIIRDISARKEADKALRDAQDAALESVRAKFEFIANVSHEIRTPMNGVLAMINLLNDTGLTPEQKEYVQQIHESGSTLITIVNDVLDFSKIESGRLTLDHIDFDLEQTVEDVCALLRVQAENKHLNLTYLICGTLPTALRGDPARLRQILMNLVDNGIKFTRRGEVTITVKMVHETEKDVRLRVEVTDSGIGMSTKMKRRIFDDMLSSHAAQQGKVSGSSGLGLSISRKLVELMGGEIGVVSKVGQGSTFWFELALDKQQEPVHIVKQQYSELKGLKALVVDNRQAWRSFLVEQMSSIGMDVQGAEEATTAIELLHQATDNDEPFQLVVFDMMMPRMNGLELAEIIREDEDIMPLRMIMVATTGYRGDSEEVRRAGIMGYLSTPVRTAQLYECISTVMRLDIDDHDTLITRHSLADTRALMQDHVLVVDEDVFDRRTLLFKIQSLGQRVHYVTTMDDALSALDHHYYGCMLVACDMAEGDGIQKFRDFRQQAGADHPLKIIALLDDEPRNGRSKCQEAGVDDYLVRPIRTKALQEKLQQYAS